MIKTLSLILLVLGLIAWVGTVVPSWARETYYPHSYAAIAHEQGKRLAAQRVERVVDGDTVILKRGGHLVSCRLIGIDAPELSRSGKPADPFGPEARDFLRGWVEGKAVRVDYERNGPDGRPERDRYGRLLVYLLADEGRQSINVALVERGIARYYGRFPTRYRAHLKLAQDDARARGLGLWAPKYLPVGDPTPRGAFRRLILTRR